MKSPTVWFVESPTTMIYFISYAIENKNVKHYVYLIKDKNNILSEKSFLFRRKLIDQLENVIFLGYRDDFDSLKTITTKSRKDFFNKEFNDIPSDAIPVFRSSSQLRKIYPPWLKAMTISHGINEYLIAASNRVSTILRVKSLVRKIISFIDYFLNGQSVFLRNIGKKISLNLNYKNSFSNKNYLTINFNNTLIKKVYSETLKLYYEKEFINLNKFGNDSCLIAFLPISIRPFELSIENVEPFYDEFMEHNLSSINNLVKLIKKPISIFVIPHPSDLISIQNKRFEISPFMEEFLLKLKDKFDNICFTCDFLDPFICYELPYEIIEKFLNPDFLLSGYPSAAILTSQLDSEKKYLGDYFYNKNMKYIWRKPNKLYKELGIDLEKNNLFKII